MNLVFVSNVLELMRRYNGDVDLDRLVEKVVDDVIEEAESIASKGMGRWQYILTLAVGGTCISHVHEDLSVLASSVSSRRITAHEQNYVPRNVWRPS